MQLQKKLETAKSKYGEVRDSLAAKWAKVRLFIEGHIPLHKMILHSDLLIALARLLILLSLPSSSHSSRL